MGFWFTDFRTAEPFPILLWNFNYADLSAAKAFNRNYFDESFSAINFVL
jgi:hypothetical protein